MTGDQEKVVGEIVPACVDFAHIEDSLAPAEYLSPTRLEQELAQLKNKHRPHHLLQRAWICNEFALATPEQEGDNELFNKSRRYLSAIVKNVPNRRHPTRFSADMLLAYEDAFRIRAKQQSINQETHTALQHKLSDLMMTYLEDDKLYEGEYGRLAELIASTYILEGGLFPYFASVREESNMISTDNHDFYTLHPCDTHRFKKVPISVKHAHNEQNPKVVTLSVGRIALSAARKTPTYSDELTTSRKDLRIAARLAADIMICHTTGEPLSREDSIFLRHMAHGVTAPLTAFAESSRAPDFASNAEVIQQIIQQRSQTST